ncbi:MAG TPA: ATP-binding protein [Gemmatimonadaceae bacterium]|nr:ATP-binding protein [Gemmatimonadaceae bacterium]
MLGLSIRARLALWYAAVFAVSLGAVSVALYGVVARRSLANVDASLHEAASAVATAIELESEGRPARDIAARVVREFRFRDLQLAVYDPSTASVIAGAPSDSEDDQVEVDSIARGIAAKTFRMDAPGLRAFLAGAPVGRVTYGNIDASDGEVRALALSTRVGRRPIVIGAVHRLHAHRRLLAELRVSIGVGIPLLLLLATLGGYVLARQSMKPVAVMTERAEHISATTLHERLPVANPGDELGRLATVFNDLLARVERAFDQQRQFIADASHELRTPVAIVSGEAELALSRDDRTPDELRAALRTIREETQGLQRIVEDLFLLARAHAGERLMTASEMYLGEVCGECVRSVRSLALRKQMTLRYDGGDELPMRGDENLLRRLFLNLLDNAIKYTPAGGSVVVSSRVENGMYVVDVSDSGTGVPPDVRERVFDRFYRVGRTHEAGDLVSGAGLGLAIARWIAEAHGGTLALARSDETGSTFRFSVPAPAQADVEAHGQLRAATLPSSSSAIHAAS